jgi:hypothetical protein
LIERGEGGGVGRRREGGGGVRREKGRAKARPKYGILLPGLPMRASFLSPAIPIRA